LHRVERLSKLLPLLSQNKYDEFSRQLTDNERTIRFSHDELDQLKLMALSLTDQLEHLDQEVRGNNFILLEKSQDLAKERDFIRQLVETAPIIILTQKLNGIILSVNQAGIDGLESDSHSIIGKVFDIFVPESDQEHLKKLNQLRMGDRSKRFQINGFLVTQSGKHRETSWLHTLLKSNDWSDEPVILSLGVDISIRNLAEEKIHKMSSYDDLTGLMNRKKFQEEFAVELASAKRYDYRVALFYLDMDQFKDINDSRDHEVGDDLLRQVANILRDAMRSTDLLCRIDGDEFTLIMPHAELKGIQQNASKINQMIEAAIFSYGGEEYRITTSIGIAIFPQHGLTVNELLTNAAIALDQAKTSGGARYQLFSPDPDYQIKLNQMLYWQEIIENAIAQDKFVLFYQPVVNIKNNEINHYECLIRLQKDDGILILPAEFLGYAEDLELIGKIDRWVLKKGIQKLIDYHRQGKSFRLSINLSASALDDATIFEDISRLINVPEVDPGTIIFEITETAAVSNFAAAETLITQLKELGCMLALDDFGVGFSSIYYLKHFPVDYIKLDGSFISQIDKNDDDKVFVKAVTGLAHSFNKEVVAEFVENEDILKVIKDFGIDYGQGNYLGKPAALD
jgi:diguanylate cyclase (GGDEF)-like protein/PAS domain S-box-containing protein